MLTPGSTSTAWVAQCARPAGHPSRRPTGRRRRHPRADARHQLTQVADFPVFPHPVSREEYALARTERKSGNGRPLAVLPEVTLEEDLQLPDLTINAMAMAANGEPIDHFPGNETWLIGPKARLTCFRGRPAARASYVARFAARYHPLGFSVAAETMALMREIVGHGELAHLRRADLDRN